ncbi:prepilin-type N-terminal cleavage/methylation domain-containing protein [Paenacidovorax monticola]|uniref:prepilin-type N-terminal cleavage/methylation domain-containing protein n=1 Tax=Paenacidovorax monticola TaxID=1926868 RepID=UPI001FEA0149|nr:prepilin-type N-terminal cleavage/methylation domain-containing protein [Paenacidovorax monticola]
MSRSSPTTGAKSSGFTLLELLVVLVLAAITVTVVGAGPRRSWTGRVTTRRSGISPASLARRGRCASRRARPWWWLISQKPDS